MDILDITAEYLDIKTEYITCLSHSWIPRYWSWIFIFLRVNEIKMITQADIFYTPGPDYTFQKVFGVLNSIPTSELLHRVKYSRNPNLKMQKTLFLAIFEVKLHRELMFFLKTRYGIWKYHIYSSKPFLNFSDIFFFWKYRPMKLSTLPFSWIQPYRKKVHPKRKRNNALLCFLGC